MTRSRFLALVWSVVGSVVFALSACAENEVRVDVYKDEGRVCLVPEGAESADAGAIGEGDSVDAWVVFKDCISHCAKVRASCEAAHDGTTIHIQGEARTETGIDPEKLCPSACQLVGARCSVGVLEAGTYRVEYGTTSRTVEVPGSDSAECGRFPPREILPPEAP
jgi:hypothetical protein